MHLPASAWHLHGATSHFGSRLALNAPPSRNPFIQQLYKLNLGCCSSPAMRRGAKALVARALLVSSGTASTALPAAATGALAALQGAVPLPRQPPLPPPAGWRPFTCGTALFDAQQQDYEDEPEQQHHEGGWRRYPQRRRHGGPPPDSPLGRLAACRTVEVGSHCFAMHAGRFSPTTSLTVHL